MLRLALQQQVSARVSFAAANTLLFSIVHKLQQAVLSKLSSALEQCSAQYMAAWQAACTAHCMGDGCACACRKASMHGGWCCSSQLINLLQAAGSTALAVHVVYGHLGGVLCCAICAQLRCGSMQCCVALCVC